MTDYKAEIMRYLKLIYTKRYLYTTIALSVMSLIVWGSYFIPKQYKAKSTVFIEQNVIEQLVKGIAITPNMNARIKVLRDTMLGRSLVLSVIKKLDLDVEAKDDAALEQIIVNFQKTTKIRVNRNGLISVSLIHRNASLARDYVNTLVNEYVENNIFAKREEAYDATRFLNTQVDFFKNRMDMSEDAIIKFRQEQGIYISLDEGRLIKEIKGYTTEIEKMKIDRNEMLAQNKSMEKQLKEEKPLSVTTISSKGMEGTIGVLQNRLRQLLLRYTESYPEVLKVRAEIEAIKQLQEEPLSADSPELADSQISAVNPVYQDLKQQMIEVESRIHAIDSRTNDIIALIKEKKEELKNIPESKKKLRDLEKERDSFYGVYQKLLERLGQSEVSKQMEIEDKASTFRIIEPAIMPTIPVSPDRVLIILAGIALGLGAGIGVIFVLDHLDNSVKTLDILKSFGYPILAVIPLMEIDDEVARVRKKDILVFSIAGIYMLCILGTLTMEYLGVTVIEDIMSNLVLKKNI